MKQFIIFNSNAH